MVKATKTLLKSFQVKVAIVFVLSMLFVATLSNYLVYRFSLDSQFKQLQDKLRIIAQTAALMIDAEVVEQIPLTREGMVTTQYKAVVERLRQVKKVNPAIWSVYLMAKTDKEGMLQFVADADIPDEKEIREGRTFYLGDTYDATRFPKMLEAFKGISSVDDTLGEDEWGMGLSGYAPVRDKNGKTVAVFGVDVSAQDVYNTQKTVHRRALLVLAVSIVLSLSLGIVLSKGITDPIERLVEGTHNVANGNLKFKIKVEGDDEISELTKSFNEMADSLQDSQQQLHNYFYNVLQSFVRILEASDEYTEGHSRRVSEYARKIAAKMGFSQEKIELLEEAALLHDIGKVGIEKSILNKKEPLTKVEWETIKKHPVVGEEIVKSVVLNKEMLSVVRSHHERHDGKGYPDQLDGEEISAFAAIISVADAYDAMVSSRAYRNALSKDQVIAELKSNRGVQFNSKVVDVLLEILNEGK